jgi:hypothetical protein
VQEPSTVKRLRLSNDDDANDTFWFTEIILSTDEIPNLNDQSQVGQVLDLSFLNCLRQQAVTTTTTTTADGSDTFFIPKSIFVRQEMIDVWSELAKNSANNDVATQVLIGSPGIGKSILFFLYALWLTWTTKTKVMYWRKAKAEGLNMVLICMEAIEDTAGHWSARILYQDRIAVEQNINDIYQLWMPRAFPDLFPFECSKDVDVLDGRVTYLLVKRTVTMFADGPNYRDKNDTKQGSIQFLCTSGGHPLPKNDEDNKFVSLLCGWKKHDLVRCLKMYAKKEMVEKIWREHLDFNNDSADDEPGEQQAADEEAGGKKEVGTIDMCDDVIEYIYYHTGGRVRDALKLLRGQKTFGDFREYAKFIIRKLPTDIVDLVLQNKFGIHAPESFDQWRTYFQVGPTEDVEYIQIVDSGYILALLGNRDMGDKYLEAYTEACTVGELTMAGHYFEKMMHQVFIRLARSGSADVPFDGRIQASGNTIEGVCQLKNEKYWIPSVPNFPGIDAAVVSSSGKVTGIQYSVGKRHGFKVRAFENTFLRYLPEGCKGECNIVYVVPSDQRGLVTDDFTFPSRLVAVDVASMTTVMQTAINVFAAVDR